MFHTLNPPSLERQGGRAGNSIKSRAMLLSFLKKNQTTPRPSEHLPVMVEKMSKRLGGIKRLQIQNLFMAFKQVRLLQSLLLPELAHSTRFGDQFHGQLTDHRLALQIL